MIEDKKIKPTITYIKDNKEKTVTLHWWNKDFLLNQIFEEMGTASFVINKDISFVHFKNFTFEFVNFFGFQASIVCPNDTVCILEECQFIKKGKGSFVLRLNNGSFQMIQPDLRYVLSMETFTNDFDLVFLNELLGSSRFKGLLKCGGGNVSIHDCGNISNLYLHYIKRAVLKNHFNLETLFIDDSVKEVIVGSDKKATTITVSDRPKIYASKLVLNNSELNCNGALESCYLVIDGKNYVLKAPHIAVNGNKYQARNGRDVVLTEKSFLEKEDGLEEKRRLISVLKARKKYLEGSIEEITKQYLQPGEEQLVELGKQIITLQGQIEKLEELQKQRSGLISENLRGNNPKKYLKREK